MALRCVDEEPNNINNPERCRDRAARRRKVDERLHSGDSASHALWSDVTSKNVQRRCEQHKTGLSHSRRLSLLVQSE